MKNNASVKLDRQGRIVIPKAVRQFLNLDIGIMFDIRVTTQNEILLTPRYIPEINVEIEKIRLPIESIIRNSVRKNATIIVTNNKYVIAGTPRYLGRAITESLKTMLRENKQIYFSSSGLIENSVTKSSCIMPIKVDDNLLGTLIIYYISAKDAIKIYPGLLGICNIIGQLLNDANTKYKI